MNARAATIAAFALAACGVAIAAALAPTPTPMPSLVLLVNGQSHDAKVVAGWPVILELDLISPDGTPCKISGGSAPWSRLVRIEMPGDLAWVFEPALAPPNEVTVDDRSSASLFFTIAPDASAKLPRGERTLRVVLECKESANGAWTGVAISRDIRLQVVEEPKRLQPAWAERKAEVAIDYAYCREGATPALARAEEAAKAQPQSWRLMAMKGRLLAGLDRRAEAVAALDAAIARWWAQNPKGCEPPSDLLARRDALAPDAAEK